MKKYLITAALPYINGIKHLGNLAGSMLPADVYARYMRLKQHDVLFICATDEHGTPAELAAAEANQPVAEYCREQHEIQKGLYRDYGLSFDWFGRTSAPENHKLTQYFYQKLQEKDLIAERKSEQVFSIDDNRFLPDRYVEGTCPKCGYTNARGDQCDGCGTLLDPMDLIDPRSKISGSKNLEVRETAHLFLRQDVMADRIRTWVDGHGDWPHLTKSIAYKWLDEGLKERSITRDLSWGVPVADESGQVRPGFENKVFYVWFDAPVGYISATEEWGNATGKDWQSWWRTDKGANDVQYIQFMGKDNVAFHTVSFPVTILGSEEPWKLVDNLKSFNWLNWYGEKFSTSQKRGVFMDQAIALLPADYWRWYLMSNAPEGSDFSFTWEGFQVSINADLANNFGNFINRIIKFCQSKFEGVVPTGGSFTEKEERLIAQLQEKLVSLDVHHSNIDIRKAANDTRAIWSIGNEYLTEAAPWTAIKTDTDYAALSTRVALNLCVLFATLALPFIPETAGKVLAAFGLDANKVAWPEGDIRAALDKLPLNATIEASLPVLFNRIEDIWVAEQKEKFAGVKQ